MSSSPDRQGSSSVQRAQAAVDALLRDPDSDPRFEPESEASARAAIERFATSFASADGWVKAVVEGARAGAQGLSGDRLQGLAEIVQNADDAGASSVRFALDVEALLVAHDGRPVALSDVFALATPWVTTKSANASATGRFGIGLMTLQTLSPTLEVYSGNYRFRLGDPTISVVDEQYVRDGFARPDDTVLRIPLEPGVLSAEEVDLWFARWDESALLFCRCVKEVTVSSAGRLLRSLRMGWEERPVSSAVVGGTSVRLQRRYAKASDGRRWAVHTADVPAPRGVHRARKAADLTTPVGMALPLQDGDGGQLYAGLPLVSTHFPARINAQFDPLTGRQGLAADSPWNNALSPLIAELWIAAAMDLFDTDPINAWRIVPTSEAPIDPRQVAVAELDALLLASARTVLPEHLTFPFGSRDVQICEMAVEDSRLEGIITDAEICSLAGSDATLPSNVRDPLGRWRDVLADWREADARLGPSVTVKDALALFNDGGRAPAANILLAAAALEDDLRDELATLECVITEDGAHIRPPASTDPWLLVADAGGLAGELGLVRRLHAAHLADTQSAQAMLAWLRERRAIGDAEDARGVLRRLVVSGRAGHRLDKPLTDQQLRALRDAFEPLSGLERAELGLGVGRVISIEAFQFDRHGKKIGSAASPAVIYLPKAIDREPDSFAFAAAQTPGLRWADSHYADALRSPLGRAGLGAQRFLRLLGAEIRPRLIPHPGLQRRYEAERRRGLSAYIAGNPPRRALALSALGATYTLEDRESPDLASVLTDIARDRKATRRRDRAAAVLATLGRAWDRLSDFAEVTAATDYYSWQTKGSVRAYWLWRAATIEWLDDNTATPRSPTDLRLRTPSTVAVHGPNASGYIHKDVFIARHDVLAALGVTGEPSTGELVNRLRELRDTALDPIPVAADAGLIFQGLADRLASRAHVLGDLSDVSLRRAFAEGAGLVSTNVGWRPPSQVLRGNPVFGDRRPFAPPVPSVDRLWTILQIRRPSATDCVAVLAEVARAAADLQLTDQTIMLETLRLLAQLVITESLGPATRRRLGVLPVWTTKGWQTARPVYAIDDPTLAQGLATEIPVWQPGGELSQFRALLSHLRLTEIAAESTTVVGAATAEEDEDASALLRAAVPLLREDLARNEPATERALDVDWDLLGALEVRIASKLRVRVAGVTELSKAVPVTAKADPEAGALYLSDPALLARVDGGGSAVAGLFAADRRRVAQAWLAACDNARTGGEALRLHLADERAAKQEAKTAAEIAVRLATFRRQTESAHTRHGTRRAAMRADLAAAGTTPIASPPVGGTPPPRVLVDPNAVRVADPRGKLVSRRQGESERTEAGKVSDPVGRRTKQLPAPAPKGAAPHYVTPPPAYSGGTKESVGLQLVRMVLASDADDMRDLRAQHGVGADAVDALDRFFELKVYAGAEPDRITLEDSQIRRAMSTPDFFLVVVSGVEGQNPSPKVRVIVDPLGQLQMTETSSVSFTGVRAAHSLVYEFVRDEQPRDPQ
jgi:hypothetical protein